MPRIDMQHEITLLPAHSLDKIVCLWPPSISLFVLLRVKHCAVCTSPQQTPEPVPRKVSLLLLMLYLFIYFNSCPKDLCAKYQHAWKETRL